MLRTPLTREEGTNDYGNEENRPVNYQQRHHHLINPPSPIRKHHQQVVF